MLQYIFIHAEASNTMDRKTITSNTMDQKTIDPITWTENHRIQKTCAKIMHKTIGGSAQPNIGSKTKIFQGVAPDLIKWGYGYPSNPLLTMWKEYNTTQQCFHWKYLTFGFRPYVRLGGPTYGFVHVFRTCFLDAMVFGPWFWTQWFLGSWYWMLRHV